MTSNAKGEPRMNPDLGVVMHRIGTSAYDKPPLPIYSDLLEGFAAHLNKRVKSDYQNVVAVVGGTGSGKSTAAFRLCKLVDPFFTLETNYIYSTADLAAKLAQPKESVSPVNFLDEGSVILNSNKHSTKESTDIVVLFDTMRSRGMTSIICIPELRSLNNRIREDHVNFLLVCGEAAPLPGFKKRGFCKLFKRTRPGGTFSHSIYWKPIAWGVYKKLTPAMNREYQQYKARSQETLLGDFYERNAVKPEEEAEG